MEDQQVSKKQQKRLDRMARKDEEKKGYQRSRLGRSFLIWTLVILILVGLVWALVLLVSSKTDSEPLSAGNIPAIGEGDWTKGNPDAQLELVEYSDFQCPACASYFPIVTQLLEEYENEILFAYRHFPLRSIHPHAQLAGQAAEAAGQQDQFWAMHDLIFENQLAWSRQIRPKASFVEYASQLSLDLEQFEADMESNETEQEVNADFNSGERAGVPGTPTFFLNGEMIQSPRSLDEFKALIDTALEAANTNGSDQSADN
ncbi:MAG: thioredoxin domain-containing protein [Candidatus Harrisonbacteria bacterium]|nr:thioredoxin domain-containing protein [Candidatus Harrisonbacteria bacterium]